MNFIKFSIITVFVLMLSHTAKSQEINYNENQVPTTMEIYNYITKGLQIQINSGLDMKRGYYIYDKMTRGVNSSDGSRNVEMKALVTENTNKVCAWIMIYKNNTGQVVYFCIPTQASSEEVWNQAFADLRDTNLATTAYLPITWAMMNLIGQLSNDARDICFTGNSLVSTTNGYKRIDEINNTDTLLVYDSKANSVKISQVVKLITHSEKKYSLYRIGFIKKDEFHVSNSSYSDNIVYLEATKNHPILTNKGSVRVDELQLNDEVYKINKNGNFETYVVSEIYENSDVVDDVYNIETKDSDNFIVNDIVVLTK